MANIEQLHTPRMKLLDNIRDIWRRAELGQIESFVFAARTTDGSVATSWSDGTSTSNLLERQVLVTHLQSDIFLALVETNFLGGGRRMKKDSSGTKRFNKLANEIKEQYVKNGVSPEKAEKWGVETAAKIKRHKDAKKAAAARKRKEKGKK